jgi:hypothetical protein
MQLFGAPTTLIAGALLLCLTPFALEAQGAADSARHDLPASALDVRVSGRWVRFWSSSEPPSHWLGESRTMRSAVKWERVADGVEQGELRLRGRGEAWRLRVILLRIDPALVSLQQEIRTRQSGTLGAWTIDSAPSGAVAAFNGGHFSGGQPWGWVVRDGLEWQPPGTGSLAAALVADLRGRTRIIPPDSIAAVRGRGVARFALQSYPMLLRDDGLVPAELQRRSELVDLSHRDARLAVGELRDGRLLVALTRFDAVGSRMSSLPFGPTIPEMAAVMGGLGCRSALLLDGGISAQLLVRGPRETQVWTGMRRVPVGVLVLGKAP